MASLRNRTLFLFGLALMVLGCSRQNDPVPVEGDPIYYLRGTLDGLPLVIEAGVGGYILKASTEQDQAGQQWYSGVFFNANQGASPGEVVIRFRDLGGYYPNQPDPVAALQPGIRITAVLDTLEYFKVKVKEVPFQAQGQAEYLSWEFGDGEMGEGDELDHFFPLGSNRFTLCGQATYPGGCNRSQCYSIDPSLPGNLEIQVDQLSNGLIRVKALPEGFQPVSYSWNLERGIASSSSELAFSSMGAFPVEQVCLDVRDPNGNLYQKCVDILQDSMQACGFNFSHERNYWTYVAHGLPSEALVEFRMTLDGQDYFASPGQEQLEILQSLSSGPDPLGNPTQTLRLKGVLWLEDGSGNQRELKIDECQMAFGILE